MRNRGVGRCRTHSSGCRSSGYCRYWCNGSSHCRDGGSRECDRYRRSCGSWCERLESRWRTQSQGDVVGAVVIVHLSGQSHRVQQNDLHRPPIRRHGYVDGMPQVRIVPPLGRVQVGEGALSSAVAQPVHEAGNEVLRVHRCSHTCELSPTQAEWGNAAARRVGASCVPLLTCPWRTHPWHGGLLLYACPRVVEPLLRLVRRGWTHWGRGVDLGRQCCVRHSARRAARTW